MSTKYLFNVTECILTHRMDFLSIIQQRTICTSTYKQCEDFDLMYLIKWGIDKYFEIALVEQFRCTSGKWYQCINHRRHVPWEIVTWPFFHDNVHFVTHDGSYLDSWYKMMLNMEHQSRKICMYPTALAYSYILYCKSIIISFMFGYYS